MTRSRWKWCRSARFALVAAIGTLLVSLVAAPAAKPTAAERKPFPEFLRKSIPSSLEDLRSIEQHVEQLIRRVSPAVVSVRVRPSTGDVMVAGSAVVISRDGLILCAAHVCGTPGRRVVITFSDGANARGETLGTNHGMDAGLIRITDRGPWPFAELSPTDGARLGDWVVALGHPGGFDPERSTVARFGRIIRLAKFIQSDCPLISGDSGGPLFDMNGHVLGIHSRISESPSENYHVPVGAFLRSWDRLANGENWGDQRHRPRSTIGVHATDDSDGCRLRQVNPGGPADDAGLKPGDVIVQINNELIKNIDQMVETVRELEPGREATIVVRRNDANVTVKVKAQTYQRRSGRRSPDQ